MAEKKPSANLLFSSDTEFSFPVPFIPVSQAQVPDSSLLSADESTDVGEEDSFVGQTSASMSHPPAFNYFSQAVTNNDPFANIGHHPGTTTAPPARTVSSSKAPTEVPVASSAHSARDPFAFQSTHPQAGFVAPPVSQYINTTYQNNQPGLSTATAFTTVSPPQTQQNYNPYRQTSQSSRASPYLPPQQLQFSQSPAQQHMPPFQSAAPTNHLYQTPPISSPQAPLGQTVSTVPPPNPISTALQPLLSPPYNIYEPVRPHWFYCKMVEGKPIWMPFSFLDTLNLEEIYNSVQPDPENVVVSTDGGRYDVYLYDRLRYAVYWEEEPTEVRRCTWFYKGDLDSRFIPYSEEFSEKLEGEYKKAVTTNQWHKRLEFASGETIVMHNPKVIVQFHASSLPDEWGTTQDGQTRPRVVKRGIDDDHDEIPEGELPQVNHLVFIAHGIGPVCDLRFRSIIECVDDFRNVSLKLLRTHFKKAVDENKISRVEFLPVHWHSALHGDATGVDRRIKKITLPSIGRLRHFTNETLLDIFFYNSPTYCQTIVDKMAAEINRLYALFLNRNPNFKGGVSLAGHSLGSLILFDLLANQTGCSLAGDSTQSASNGTVKDSASPEESQDQNCQDTEDLNELKDEQEEEFQSLSEVFESLSLSEYLTTLEKEKIDVESLLMCTVDDLKEMGIPLGPRKKIANFVKEKVNAQAKNKAATEKRAALEAMKKAQQEALHKAKEEAADTNSLAGEKQSMLKRVLSCGAATVSSVKVHYDRFEAGAGQVSVAYRGLDFEPDNFFALGSPIGMFLTVRGLERIDENYRLPTCRGFFNIYHPLDPVAYRIEPMILPDLDIKPVLVPHHKGRKRLHLELKESLSRMGSDLKQGFISSLKNAWQTLNEFARAHTSTQLQVELEKVANQIKEEEDKHVEEEQKLVESPESSKDEDSAVKIGMLNGGQRIDYVLQEKPIESFNEYLFALQSHLCYWESEDTALLFLKEIYKSMCISPEQPPH